MADYANIQKGRTGIDRIWKAGLISLNGLKAAMREKAFRQELVVAFFLVPTSFYFGNAWYESALLFMSIMLVLISEILNSAIEATVDRIGPEWHFLSGKAKDMGSAAVALSLLTAAVVWISALIHHFITGP